MPGRLPGPLDPAQIAAFSRHVGWVACDSAPSAMPDSASATLTWSAALDTGLDDVDREHRRLLDIFNRVAGTRDRDALESALRELSDYAVYHFGTEARLMRRWPLSASHRRAHCRAHQRFRGFLGRARELLDADPDAVAGEVSLFLAQWLQHHIMGMDRRMAEDILALQQGRPPIERALGDAFDALFDGLCERTLALVAARCQLRDAAKRRGELEATLRDSNGRYRDLFLHAPDALYVSDARQCILVANHAGLALLGADSLAQIEGRPVSRFFDPADDLAPVDAVARRLDGATLPVEVRAAPPDRRGWRHLMVRDISERRDLQRRVLEATRVEQERLGRELHDGTGQRLVAIGLLARAVQRGLGHGNSAHAARMAAELERCAGEALNEVRGLVRGIAPLRLAPGSLSEALAALCASLGCRYAPQGQPGDLDPDVALQLYRIAQEALSNAIRHSGARTVDLLLRAEDQVLTLCVRDDGCGLGADVQPGLGLSTMRFRAAAIGATLSIGAGDSGGTAIVCSLTRAAAAAAASQH